MGLNGSGGRGIEPLPWALVACGSGPPHYVAAMGEIHEWSEGGLRLVLLEESARKAGPMLLSEQHVYFRNVRDWLTYLHVAYAASGASSGRGLRPKRPKKPVRHLLPDQAPTPA